MAHRPTAAFFDLDKTIIAKSSTLAFSKSFQAGGLISRRAVLRSAYAQFVYLVGGADHDQMEKMRQFMSQLCAGWDVATVREIVADTLHNIVDPLVYDEAVSLIRQLVPSALTGSDPVPFRDQLFRIRVAEISGRASGSTGGKRVASALEKTTIQLSDADLDAILGQRVESALAKRSISAGCPARVRRRYGGASGA